MLDLFFGISFDTGTSQPTGADFYNEPRQDNLTKRGQMSLHTKHNIKSKNLKTPFNRGVENHNIKFRKHDIKFSGSGLKLNKSSFVIPSIIFGLVGITIVCGFILSQPKSSTSANAATSTVTASVVVPSACTLSGTIASGDEHIKTMTAGTYEGAIGKTTIKAVCNDPNGFDIYAVGYSGTSSDLYNTAGTVGNTNMISSYGSTIATGLNNGTSVLGDGSSNWSMKLSLSGSNNGYTPNILSDANGSFAEYHVVPSTSTKVATFNSMVDSSVGSSIDTTYAVYLQPSQPAGTYVGQVKYTITHPTTTFTYYMQDFTTAMCNELGTSTEKTITLYDKRDNNSYTVAYINGQCWMTQNLRLTGGTNTLTLSGALSNVTSYIMPAESTSNFSYDTGYAADGHKCDADKNKGCWYNYYSATAGTIFGNSNSTAATSDICPKNWHLPTGPNATEGTDFSQLVGNTTSGWQAATAGLTAFSAVAGGVYNDGSLGNIGIGYWWSATAVNTTYRYYLSYVSRNGQVYGSDYSYRHRGGFVRCVHD